MSIETPKIIRRNCHYDKRGYLQEIYLKKKEKKIFKFSLVTSSKKNVFRGFHVQLKKQQAKLVYIVKGKVLDFVIDLRKRSKKFAKVYKFRLKEKDILYIPKGFAHGYLSLASENIVLYYLTEYRDAKSEDGIAWNDKVLNIKFPIKNIKVSQKDKKLKTLKDFIKRNKSL
tara:strand:- start:5 stop:517 length:513 start_codon:yes stop_codon:yes gene_type:complete